MASIRWQMAGVLAASMLLWSSPMCMADDMTVAPGAKADCPAACSESVSQESPVNCVRSFFEAVRDERFADCWELLSTDSQKQVARLVATEMELEAKDRRGSSPDFLNERVVAAIFASGNNSITRAFWGQLRDKIVADDALTLDWQESFNNGASARVAVNDNKGFYFVTLHERGQWRLGLMESIMEHALPEKP